MSERLTADISADLRAFAQDMRVEHRNTDARLLAEAADKLDGLIALLAEAETARDQLVRDAGWLTLERQRLTGLLDDAHAEVAETTARFCRVAETIRRVREVHSPVPDWEREWKDPIEALRKGWPPCAGCATVATFTPIGKCRTLAALRVGDIPSAPGTTQ